jgi:YhcH/YjgK/YiaL family protein
MSALQWLRNLSPEIVPGIHQFLGDGIFANVHGHATKPSAACRYESHRRYIDLQFGLAGSEWIEWHATANLQPTDEYDPGKDAIHYAAPPEPDGRVLLGLRRFVIFFPEDGHMPKVAGGPDARVDKLVIKIDPQAVEVKCRPGPR